MKLFSSNKKQVPVQKKDQIDTVIGPGTRFEGEIKAVGIVRIDGFFNGNMLTQGDIIIGDQGEANGVLTADNMIIAGKSKAKLICEDKLEIKATGNVTGDVEVNTIIIEENAVFKGQCFMRNEEETTNKAKKDNLEKEVIEQKTDSNEDITITKKTDENTKNKNKKKNNQ